MKLMWTLEKLMIILEKKDRFCDNRAEEKRGGPCHDAQSASLLLQRRPLPQHHPGGQAHVRDAACGLFGDTGVGEGVLHNALYLYEQPTGAHRRG